MASSVRARTTRPRADDPSGRVLMASTATLGPPPRRRAGAHDDAAAGRHPPWPRATIDRPALRARAGVDQPPPADRHADRRRRVGGHRRPPPVGARGGSSRCSWPAARSWRSVIGRTTADVTVVSLPAGIEPDSFDVSSADPSGDDTVVLLGDDEPVAVQIGELASVDVAEATPVLDEGGRLVGLATGEPDAPLDAAGRRRCRPARRPRRRRSRRPARRPRRLRPPTTTTPTTTTTSTTTTSTTAPPTTVDRPTHHGGTGDGAAVERGCACVDRRAYGNDERRRRSHRRNRLTAQPAECGGAGAPSPAERQLLAPLGRDHRPPARLGALDVGLLVGDGRPPAVRLQAIVGDEPRLARVAAQPRRDRAALEPPAQRVDAPRPAGRAAARAGRSRSARAPGRRGPSRRERR